MGFFILMAIYGFLSIILETTVLAHFPMSALRFDFIIVAIAGMSFYQEWRKALPVLILYGLMMDIESSAPFGMSVISYVVVFTAIRAVISQISFQMGLALFFWVAVESLLDKSVSALIMATVTGDLTIPKIIMMRAPIQAAFDAVIGMIMIPFMPRLWNFSWDRMTRPKGLVLR